MKKLFTVVCIISFCVLLFACKPVEPTPSSSKEQKVFSSYEIEYPSNVITTIKGSEIANVEYGADYSILITLKNNMQIHTANYKKLND
jgi:hypothetical protein